MTFLDNDLRATKILFTILVMIIAVIAANGRAGEAFVHMALSRGHQVRAGVFGSHTFENQPGLAVIPCNATNAEDVATLIAGADAVVSLIGHVRHSPADVQTRAVETVLAEMHATGLRRIVSLTGTGVRFPGDKITLLDRMLNLAISHIDPKRIQDGINHAAVLEASEADWTLVRVLKLTSAALQPFGLSPAGPTRLFASRATVAAAICKVLEDNSFVRQAPIITKR